MAKRPRDRQPMTLPGWGERPYTGVRGCAELAVRVSIGIPPSEFRVSRSVALSRSRQSPPKQGSFVGRFLRRQAWLIVFTGYAAILFAGFFSLDYRDQSTAHSLAAWL